VFVLARDQAFFKVLFFSGDRCSDLGVVRTEEIRRFPQDDGLLFSHVWSENPERWRLQRLRDSEKSSELYPVKVIETYVAVASELRVSVTNGYLFLPTNPQGHIVNKPFTSSSAEARL